MIVQLKHILLCCGKFTTSCVGCSDVIRPGTCETAESLPVSSSLSLFKTQGTMQRKNDTTPTHFNNLEYPRTQTRQYSVRAALTNLRFTVRSHRLKYRLSGAVDD